MPIKKRLTSRWKLPLPHIAKIVIVIIMIMIFYDIPMYIQCVCLPYAKQDRILFLLHMYYVLIRWTQCVFHRAIPNVRYGHGCHRSHNAKCNQEPTDSSSKKSPKKHLLLNGEKDQRMNGRSKRTNVWRELFVGGGAKNSCCFCCK